MHHRFWLVLFLFGWCVLAHAANIMREERLAAELEGRIVIGEAKMLTAGNVTFLALFAETEIDSRQGVILIHGLGAHPDWPDVIHPLRTILPEHGWSTLSIQAPILATSADFDDYLEILTEITPRLEAAIQFYKGIGVEEIFIIGHSFGAVMATYYMSTFEKETELRGLVAISLTGRKYKDFNPLALIEKVKAPMLDIYGGFDHATVKNTARAKKLAATRGRNSQYRQARIAEAGHFYRGAEEPLLKKIRGWMRSILQPENR